MEAFGESALLGLKSFDNGKICTVSKTQELMFMIKHYPSPKFVEMSFDSTSASSNQSSDHSAEHSDHSAEYSAEKSDRSSQSIDEAVSESNMCLTVQKSTPKNQSIGSNGLSEIKARNFGFDFQSKRNNKEYAKRSAFETEFDYQELLGQLSFQDKASSKNHFSAQKEPRKIEEFDIQRGEKSVEKQIWEDKDDSKIEYKNQKIEIPQKAEKHAENKSQKKSIEKLFQSNFEISYKWDSPSEIQFRKQNKLKWMVNVFDYREEQSLQEAFKKIRLYARRKPCKKCRQPMPKHEESNLCGNCRFRESSKVDKYSIGERSLSRDIESEMNSEIYE